jgi:hypothetical protein
VQELPGLLVAVPIAFMYDTKSYIYFQASIDVLRDEQENLSTMT